MKSPNRRVLVWFSFRGWEVVTKHELRQYYAANPQIDWKESFIGKVRQVIETEREQGVTIELRRYRETWEYKGDQKRFDQVEEEAELEKLEA